MPKKGGFGQFADLKGDLARKRGWVFFFSGGGGRGVDTPMHTMIYDKAFIKPFHTKLESLQYNAKLAITEPYEGLLLRKFMDIL